MTRRPWIVGCGGAQWVAIDPTETTRRRARTRPEDHVLLVDPNLEVLAALRACFEADGYRVTLAIDGMMPFIGSAR